MTVQLVDLHSLPIYPSSSTLRTLPPSQQATILSHISSSLFYALSLSNEKLSRLLCVDFLTSYARQEAIKRLDELIFPVESKGADRRTSQEKVIRKRVLSLALRLADLTGAGGITLQTILDICVAYGPQNTRKVRDLVEKAVKSNPVLLDEIRNSVVLSFAAILLSTNSGLHALRKSTFCLKCLLQCSPSSVLDAFVKDNEFVLALSKSYDARLSAIAAGYGGISLDRVDDTETTSLWVGCKVDLIDGFHALLEHVLQGVRADPRANAEGAFDLVFSLLKISSPSAQSSSTHPTPFLNRSLVADYQDAYALSSTLASVLSNTDDPRLDVLEATLKSFEAEVNEGSDKRGALKILLRSSGMPPGIDYRGIGVGRGKARAAASEPAPVPNFDIDAAVSSILDVLPDQEPAYLRALLALPQYSGSTERVIASILEGEAPPSSTLQLGSLHEPTHTRIPTRRATPVPERRNIFDEQPLEARNVQIGKRREDADGLLQDRAFLDQMKADILRRAVELSESDGDEGGDSVDDVDDLDSILDGGVKVIADREDIEGESGEEDVEGVTESQLQTPETICEVEYIKDPKVFDRDAATRRSKARADLKARTGWSDEQLEGWRIMLEKNPRKDKILQNHEFTGNKKGAIINIAPERPGPSESSGRGRGYGRGRGRGGQGRGRGTRGGGGGGGNNEARERAWKDKNKARQANHNRKRGHDRKLARGGAVPGPSS